MKNLSVDKIKIKAESIALMNNKKFMTSLRKAKKQIKNRDFANWNAL